MLSSPALHRSIVVVDVAGFTDRSRTEIHQVVVHHGLYDILNEAFSTAGIDLAVCAVEDRGDGAMILVPPEIPKSVLANRLPSGLIAALRRHNAVHSAEARVQLRVVLHAGEVSRNANGVVGQAVNLAFRILDAGAAKLALRQASGALALIASDQFYRDVIVHDPAAEPAAYRQIPVSVKGATTTAWLRLPDGGTDPAPAGRSHRSATPAISIRHEIAATIGRPQNLRRFLGYTLATFALVTVVAQAAGIEASTNLWDSTVYTGTVLVFCVCCGLWSVWPVTRIHREFQHPPIRVAVVVGNLLEQQAHLVVGFADTFDTDTTGDRIVNRASVQGQLLHRVYGGDRDRLDRDLADALCHSQPNTVESRRDKPLGKLERYSIGTVAVLPGAETRIFCSAYSRMGNDLVARSTVEELWSSLGLLWDAVSEYGQRAPVAMPIVGSELARIDSLDRENLMKMILLNFVARSRKGVFCKELVLVVHPKDIVTIDMAEMRSFLRRL